MEAGFVYLNEELDNIKWDIRYATGNNLTGKPLSGYQANKPVGTIQLWHGLVKAVSAASERGLGLFIFDAYRPQKAVDDLVAWTKCPETEKAEVQLLKEKYYPKVEKADMLNQGYIAERSGHSRGSVIDLTLMRLSDGIFLDMGTIFDFMDEKSHHGSDKVGQIAAENRLLLKKIMEESGFLCYEKEWWHYRLENEPFPDTYFNFDIT